MLQTKTVEPSILALLKRLMQLDVLNDFSFIGGTALSLVYGHRISIDLDLFSETPFNNTQVIEGLEKEFGEDFFCN